MDLETLFDVDRLRQSVQDAAEPSSGPSSETQPSPGSSYRPSPEKPFTVDAIPFEYKKKAVAFWNSGQRGRKNFTSVKKNFRRVSNVTVLYAWQKLVDAGGSRSDKLRQVYNLTRDAFMDAEREHGIVHDQVGLTL